MNTIVLFFSMGIYEIVLIFAIVLLLFGGNKIPELMRGLGKGIREFNSAKATIEGEIKEGMCEADRKALEEKQKNNEQ